MRNIRQTKWVVCLAVAASTLGGELAAQPGSLELPSVPGPEAPGNEVGERSQPVSTISLDEISRGQRGYGLSVFAGREMERFEVEVLGVLRDFSPQASAIIARLTGQGLEKSGVIAGMSGSPVYIDGRLAGAVAFSWNYAKEAIAGITPIAAMRRLATASPGAPAAAPRGSSLPVDLDLEKLAKGELPEDLLVRELRRLGAAPAEGAASGLVWSAGGFGATSRDLLASALGPVATAGTMAMGAAGASDVDLALPPGSPVAAALIRGDFQLAATGTVTDRFGDQVLAFGHPFLGFGPVRVPMAAAEVVTVIASTANSFKLSNLGPVVGAFEQDRQAGVLGRLAAKAPTVPLTVHVRGEGIPEPRTFEMELAEIKELLPTLIGVAAVGALENAGHSSGPQTIDLELRLALAGQPDLVVEQSFDGNGAANNAAVYLLSVAALAIQSPLGDSHATAIEVDLVRSAGGRIARLAGAFPAERRVEPGQTVTVFLDWMLHGGERKRQELAVKVPADLPDGAYHVLLGDGVSMDSLRFALEPAPAGDYRQLLRQIASLTSRRELVVFGLLASPGIAAGGEVMPQLPGSIRSLWDGAGVAVATPLPLAIVDRRTEPLPFVADGFTRVDFDVRRNANLGQR